MATTWRALSVIVLAALVLLTAPWVEAAAPRVADQASLFSPAVVEEANRIIERIYSETGPPHKDVLVETLDRLPPGKEIRDVADAEFRARKGNGLLILLIKDPGKLWVTVGEDTRKGFGTAEVEELVSKIMIPRLREKKADQALLDGLRFVQRKLEVFRAGTVTPRATAPAAAARVTPAVAREASAGINWLWVILVLLAVWLVIGLIRSIFRRFSGGGAAPGYAPGGGPGYAPSYGGGGWGTAILGGLLGAVAGNWIYNHVLGGGQSSGWSSWGADTTSAADRSESVMTPGDEGRISGGGGGDWGDSGSGGADFGGGDDVGGGTDFGGGGDFGGSD